LLPEQNSNMDDRDLRLYDLARHETIRVRCRCGRIVEFMHGVIQRRLHLPSDTMLIDLQFRLKCSSCNAREGFQISLFDERNRYSNEEARRERVIVAGDPVISRIAAGSRTRLMQACPLPSRCQKRPSAAACGGWAMSHVDRAGAWRLSSGGLDLRQRHRR
jgi:hypothetical protein